MVFTGGKAGGGVGHLPLTEIGGAVSAPVPKGQGRRDRRRLCALIRGDATGPPLEAAKYRPDPPRI